MQRPATTPTNQSSTSSSPKRTVPRGRRFGRPCCYPASMEAKPRIGVTRWSDVPDEARDRYWARVSEAGGEVIDINESAAGRERDIAPSLDALVLTGGIDVDPSKYGAKERHPKVKE